MQGFRLHPSSVSVGFASKWVRKADSFRYGLGLDEVSWSRKKEVVVVTLVYERTTTPLASASACGTRVESKLQDFVTGVVVGPEVGGG